MRPLATNSKRSAPFDPIASLFSVGSPLIRNFDPRGSLAAARAPALLRSSPTTNSSARSRVACFQQFAHGKHHGRDDAFGVACAPPPNVLGRLLAMGRTAEPCPCAWKASPLVAPPCENVEALRLLPAFVRHARQTAHAISDTCANSTLPICSSLLGDRLDVHQRAR